MKALRGIRECGSGNVGPASEITRGSACDSESGMSGQAAATSLFLWPKANIRAATRRRAIVNCCGRWFELGGGLVESEAVLEGDSLNDIG
jgi:hypothetical protein